MEKEYIVILNPDIDFDAFNQEMIDNTGAGFIPNRTVDIANPRPGSQRSTHYSLTDEEAEELKNDPRVRDVEIPPQDRDDIVLGFDASQVGDFRKPLGNWNSGSGLNWGMCRCINKETPYITNVFTGQGYSFTYTLDGTGVDVVVLDSGIQADHPEFNDADGVSRVQQINWYTESGISGTQSGNHYEDLDGHGTHVAGTACGLTFGWAKNARIYSVKVDGLDGTVTHGISQTDMFDVIKGWHNNKPIEPTTGYKRPTIVNMSIGWSESIGSDFSVITSVNYRGTTYDSNTPRWHESDDYMSETYGLYPYKPGSNYLFPVRVASVDSDVEEMIAAGIHVCISAGNNSFKIDTSTGVDYNNTAYASSLGGSAHYHRGGSPYSEEAFIVGSVDSIHSIYTGEEQISSFSTRGPGVTMWAPGSNIKSAFSNTNGENDADYYLNSSYKQGTISGTSMASPQVCGVGATILEKDPHLTPLQLKEKIIKLATPVSFYQSTVTNYNLERAPLGSPNRLLYTPFNNEFMCYSIDLTEEVNGNWSQTTFNINVPNIEEDTHAHTSQYFTGGAPSGLRRIAAQVISPDSSDALWSYGSISFDSTHNSETNISALDGTVKWTPSGILDYEYTASHHIEGYASNPGCDYAGSDGMEFNIVVTRDNENSSAPNNVHFATITIDNGGSAPTSSSIVAQINSFFIQIQNSYFFSNWETVTNDSSGLEGIFISMSDRSVAILIEEVTPGVLEKLGFGSNRTYSAANNPLGRNFPAEGMTKSYYPDSSKIIIEYLIF